jgi:hypothetical protein
LKGLPVRESDVSKSESKNTSNLEDFKAILFAISSMAQASGIKVVPWNDSSLSYFSLMNPVAQASIISSARIFERICSETYEEYKTLKESKAFIWRALKYYGLYPVSNVFEFFEKEMVIELYTKEGLQLFRNFRFMEICSYCLADILTRPWFELFERNDALNADIGCELSKVMSGGGATLPSSTPTHRIHEAFSEERLFFDMQFKFFSPVFQKGISTPVGFICGSNATVAGASAKLQTSEKLQSSAQPQSSIRLQPLN